MDDAYITAFMKHGKLGDAVLPHLVQGVGHQVVLVDGLGVWGHDLAGFDMLDVGMFQQHAPKVAVGDDAQEFALVGDHGCSQTFLGHLDDDLCQAVVWADFGFFVVDIQILDLVLRHGAHHLSKRWKGIFGLDKQHCLLDCVGSIAVVVGGEKRGGSLTENGKRRTESFFH